MPGCCLVQGPQYEREETEYVHKSNNAEENTALNILGFHSICLSIALGWNQAMSHNDESMIWVAVLSER